jgi:hypothetical protein
MSYQEEIEELKLAIDKLHMRKRIEGSNKDLDNCIKWLTELLRVKEILG